MIDTGNAVSDLRAWDGYTACTSPAQCLAEICQPPDALTTPQWNVLYPG